jgi:methylmalonyl-CoA mutase, N-terminal domain
MERTSESGFPIDPVCDASKLTDFQPEAKLGRPGEYPFTRGVYPLAAVLGGTQSPHPDSYDEALALPSTKAARLAVCTQPVIAHESDLTATVHPSAGSCAIESAACQMAREIDEGDRIAVGVNKFATDGTGNVLYPRRDALRADVTLGEVRDALRVV